MTDQPTQSFGERVWQAIVSLPRPEGGKVDRKQAIATIDALYAEETAKKPKAKVIIRKPSNNEIDEAWLLGLENNPTYAGIDIRNQLGRAQAWASLPGRPGLVSRKRFLNWLNRVERPVAVNGQGQSSFQRPKPLHFIPEPTGWELWIRENTEAGHLTQKRWEDLEAYQKKFITEKMSRATA